MAFENLQDSAEKLQSFSKQSNAYDVHSYEAGLGTNHDIYMSRMGREVPNVRAREDGSFEDPRRFAGGGFLSTSWPGAQGAQIAAVYSSGLLKMAKFE